MIEKLKERQSDLEKSNKTRLEKHQLRLINEIIKLIEDNGVENSKKIIEVKMEFLINNQPHEDEWEDNYEELEYFTLKNIIDILNNQEIEWEDPADYDY